MKYIQHYLLIFISINLVIACSATKEVAAPNLITKNVDKDSTYLVIENDKSRLYAMLTGKFQQYNTKKTGLEPWLINNGKDSVMLSIFPVKDAQTGNYWLYHYQWMTSLPDDPLMTAFSRLEKVGQDTFLQIFYDSPKEFSPKARNLLDSSIQVFAQFEFDSLKLSWENEQAIYWKKNAVFFEGESSIVSGDKKREYRHFEKDFFEVKPAKTTVFRRFYNKDKTRYVPSGPDVFMKMANMKGFDKSK